MKRNASVSLAAKVFPFRVNQYVVDELIEWQNWQADPLFRLLFPQKEMLLDAHQEQLSQALDSKIEILLVRK